jgi:hypothetical protein
MVGGEEAVGHDDDGFRPRVRERLELRIEVVPVTHGRFLHGQALRRGIPAQALNGIDRVGAGRVRQDADRVDAARDEVGGERRIALLAALREALVVTDVVAVPVAQLAKGLAKALERRKAGAHQDADPLRIACLRMRP